MSEKLLKLLKNKCPDTTISFKSHNTVRQKCFSKLKDKTSTQELSSVVYKTKQKIRNRNYGHSSQFQMQRSNLGGLASHLIENGHEFDFKNTVVLENESNFVKRKCLEGIHIFLSKGKNTNSRDELGNYSAIYNNIFIAVIYLSKIKCR